MAGVRAMFGQARPEASPYGEFFFANVGRERVLFFEGGWGKIAAAGSTQSVIDRFQPSRLINLGTCGGVQGRIRRFDVVAVERVVVYDIAEAMGDPLTPAGLRDLESHQPLVADWESGAITWVAHRNSKPLLILRGVSDLASPERGEAQGNLALFEQNARAVMERLMRDLGKWLAAWR